MPASDPTPPRVARALAETLQAALAQGRAVDVPGLGSFRRRHVPGHVETQDGRRVMLPPADVVAFHPARGGTPDR